MPGILDFGNDWFYSRLWNEESELKVLVCGSRKLTNAWLVGTVLDGLNHRRKGQLELIVGRARGADTFAEDWADNHEVPVDPYPVSQRDWDRYGKRAGFLRNKRMLNEGQPDLVVAFFISPYDDPNENRGTRNMCTLAEKAKVEVWRIIAA